MKRVNTERGEFELRDGIKMSVSVDWSSPNPVIHYFCYRADAETAGILDKGTIALGPDEKARLGKLLSASADARWMLDSEPGGEGHRDVTEAFAEVRRIARQWAEQHLDKL